MFQVVQFQFFVHKIAKNDIYEPTKIFVGGLPSTADEDKLQKCFESYGEILEVSLKKDETGKSRGFGFVSFKNDDHARDALANYNQHKIDDKWVEVKAAEKQSVIMQRRTAEKGKGKGNQHAGFGNQQMMIQDNQQYQQPQMHQQQQQWNPMQAQQQQYQQPMQNNQMMV